MHVLLARLGKVGVEVVPLIGYAVRDLNIPDVWFVADDLCSRVFGNIFPVAARIADFPIRGGASGSSRTASSVKRSAKSLGIMSQSCRDILLMESFDSPLSIGPRDTSHR